MPLTINPLKLRPLPARITALRLTCSASTLSPSTALLRRHSHLPAPGRQRQRRRGETLHPMTPDDDTPGFFELSFLAKPN